MLIGFWGTQTFERLNKKKLKLRTWIIVGIIHKNSLYIIGLKYIGCTSSFIFIFRDINYKAEVELTL